MRVSTLFWSLSPAREQAAVGHFPGPAIGVTGRRTNWIGHVPTRLPGQIEATREDSNVCGREREWNSRGLTIEEGRKQRRRRVFPG